MAEELRHAAEEARQLQHEISIGVRELVEEFHQARSDRLHDGPPQGNGASTMPKELKNKREEKKKPTMTPKEKKAAKRSKKDTHVVKSA